MYAITARVVTTTIHSRGARSETVTELPTFYLDARVQGIVSTEHAERIARSILDRPGAVIVANATLVPGPDTDDEPDREPSPETERGWDHREDDARGHALTRVPSDDEIRNG